MKSEVYKGSLKEMFRHYAPILEQYFWEKKKEFIQLPVTGETQDETIKKAYVRDTSIALLDEIFEDFKNGYGEFSS